MRSHYLVHWHARALLTLFCLFISQLPSQVLRMTGQSLRLPVKTSCPHGDPQPVRMSKPSPPTVPSCAFRFSPLFTSTPPVLTTLDGNDSQAAEVDTKSSILAFSQKTPRNSLGGREMYILDHLPDHRWQHRNPNLLSYKCFSLLIYQENLKVWAAQVQFPHHVLQNLQGHRCAHLSARLSPRLPGGCQEGRGGSASCPVDSDLTMHRGA